MSADLLNGTPGNPGPLRDSILRHVRYTLARPDGNPAPRELFKPLSLAIRDLLIDRLLQTEQRYRVQESKRLYYLSMEFLMGRWLSDNLCNLGLMDACRYVPLGRFRTWLEASGNLEAYLGRLAEAFNPCAIDGLMCRTLVSVGWDGSAPSVGICCV